MGKMSSVNAEDIGQAVRLRRNRDVLDELRDQVDLGQQEGFLPRGPLDQDGRGIVPATPGLSLSVIVKAHSKGDSI